MTTVHASYLLSVQILPRVFRDSANERRHTPHGGEVLGLQDLATIERGVEVVRPWLVPRPHIAVRLLLAQQPGGGVGSGHGLASCLAASHPTLSPIRKHHHSDGDTCQEGE